MYKYELHSHTHECDRDARLSAAELVHAYKEAGYDGLVITDHYIERFYTRWFPEDVQGLSHEQQVKRWLRGYYTAREEGEKIKAIQIAQKLISTGMSLEEACDFVGISKDTMILS